MEIFQSHTSYCEWQIQADECKISSDNLHGNVTTISQFFDNFPNKYFILVADD